MKNKGINGLIGWLLFLRLRINIGFDGEIMCIKDGFGDKLADTVQDVDIRFQNSMGIKITACILGVQDSQRLWKSLQSSFSVESGIVVGDIEMQLSTR